MTRKVSVFVGTRPEVIKMAPVILKLRELDQDFQVTICVTGQHREMLKQAMDIFGLQPDVDFKVMRKSQTLASVTSTILSSASSYFEQNSPDYVLVHGDTSTAFSTGLAAFYAGVPVGHVEAGLRTWDMFSPFPEEFNRQALGRISSFHFAPTEWCRENLLSEKVDNEHIIVTGNTVVDALLEIKAKLDSDSSLRNQILTELKIELGFDPSIEPFVLVTAHRRENLGAGLSSICEALEELSRIWPSIQFLYPVHPNPSVNDFVRHRLNGFDNVRLVAPLDYMKFVYLMERMLLVLTDSGGIQEEAPTFGKPVLVMRDETERPEGVAAGTSLLVGAKSSQIVEETSRILSADSKDSSVTAESNPFGDGKAAERIVAELRDRSSL